jgi:hypothetical protein
VLELLIEKLLGCLGLLMAQQRNPGDIGRHRPALDLERLPEDLDVEPPDRPGQLLDHLVTGLGALAAAAQRQRARTGERRSDAAQQRSA